MLWSCLFFSSDWIFEWKNLSFWWCDAVELCRLKKQSFLWGKLRICSCLCACWRFVKWEKQSELLNDLHKGEWTLMRRKWSPSTILLRSCLHSCIFKMESHWCWVFTSNEPSTLFSVSRTWVSVMLLYSRTFIILPLASEFFCSDEANKQIRQCIFSLKILPLIHWFFGPIRIRNSISRLETMDE